MRKMTFRKSTVALALASAMMLGALPALAQGGGESSGDANTNQLDSRMFNNAESYSTATTTYYTAPAYVPVVPVPQPQTATTYMSPNGTTTTTTYGGGVAYVPTAPAYSSTTVVTTKPCNPYDVPRPGVTTACPY